MNTNSSTSTLSSKDSLNYHNLDTQSLTITQPNQLDQPNQQQKKSIARIYSEQAWMYFQEQNWHKAMIACKNALEIASDTVDAYKILGNILQRQGKQAEALGAYAKALAYNPNSAVIYANLGSLYAEQKNWHNALDYFQQAVILDPNLAGAYRSLAQIWEELGDINQALECFCQAVNLEPEILTAEEHFNFAQELYQQGKIKEASVFYIQGVKLNPQAKQELTQLVKVLEELEEWKKAVFYYHQLISLASPNSDRQSSIKKDKPIKNLLSQSKLKAKRRNVPQAHIISPSPKSAVPRLLPKAESSSSALVAIPSKNPASEMQHPASAVAWNNLGSLYAQKQQWAKAISCYQEALQLDAKYSKSYRNLARVYQKLGEQQKATLYWYEAFTLEPNRVKPEEYFSLAKNLLEQRQVEKAIACLRRTIELKPNFEQAHLILGKLLESQEK